MATVVSDNQREWLIECDRDLTSSRCLNVENGLRPSVPRILVLLLGKDAPTRPRGSLGCEWEGRAVLVCPGLGGPVR